MNPSFKTRTSDEALDEHIQQLKATTAQRKQNLNKIYGNNKTSSSILPIPPTPPAAKHQQQPMEEMRMRSDSSATSIYVMGHNSTIKDPYASNNTTLDRKQEHRLSWVNMRRRAESGAGSISGNSRGGGSSNMVPPITPSPQTTRSYISNITTTELMGSNVIGRGAGIRDVGGGVGGSGGVGTISGRTTATSGRISSSGITTISGSNNTLNDIHSDYHSQDVGGTGSDYHNFSRIGVSPMKQHLSVNSSFNLANGSTVKLLTATDDESNQQTKCSVFRGLVLCICLNVTYANVVRFPREMDKYGLAYLIPYLILLFLVGLPIVLLEISVGQFLGQGAAHTWRSSPIFKGACIVSRFASWVSTVWVSLQAVMALAYVGMFAFNSFPFRECLGNLRLAADGYALSNISGQECMEKTFLTPFWENPFFYGILSIGLIGLWAVVMLCTHNGRVLRRVLFIFGLLGFLLLCCLTGWEIHNSLDKITPYFPPLYGFTKEYLYESNLWFSALMQVIFALNCGFGVLPMITGKFLYKGDAVRTSVVYLCFNLLINAIAVTLFMIQFDHSANGAYMIEELKPLTTIYDRILYDKPLYELWIKLLPSLVYVLVVISCFITIVVGIYTCTRLVPRHPNYVISLVGLVASIISLSAPKFYIARLLDSRIVGTMIITALVFELIAVTWIYGVKNIYTDLEFSIGRPIYKIWLGLWCICPAILTGLLVWWCSDDDEFDLLANIMPRWAPILFVLFVIMVIACIQIFRQVEYNFFGMICEASKSAKEWGPADPLARHAWKQWRSVCQDTGQRDFTLRRRGTRDYTHSIKKGQYSTSNKYANGTAGMAGSTNNQHNNWKSSTPGNSSPNYSGSVFGDSAIEEDISVDKFPGITQQFVPFHSNETNNKPARQSHRSRSQPRTGHQLPQPQQPQATTTTQRLQHHSSQIELRPNNTEPNTSSNTTNTKHREIVYIRRLSSEEGQHATRIEITPSQESISYAPTRNPMARSSGSHGNANNYVKRTSSSSKMENNRNISKPTPLAADVNNSDHICWRKFSMNPQEYSTEL
ncbi:sodium-dependent nutrient amino acid transporter 1 isoform X1 [Lucilia cuprina]|uniref:sodium-dependent nutrient amino acid transporter 1 isoform X1 n=1 Tax=Lucilia cuprina TaxID=7375 RepID=UPI001F068297|nr:sodium-dependent nutrient amino acid transporter 1 isoform X1 [Lucilia cuprina]XP_046806916.1 sodium-dependent nutrient amino acid transporter 1 isoform X1 [Lucilia cuprina]